MQYIFPSKDTPQVIFRGSAVATVHDQQRILADGAVARAAMAEALQDDVATAIDAGKQQNQELSELAVRVESRMNVTEECVHVLEEQLSLARESVEISRTGVLLGRHEETASRLSSLITQMATKGSYRFHQTDSMQAGMEEPELQTSDHMASDDDIDSVSNSSEISRQEDDFAEKLLEDSLGPSALPDGVIDVTDVTDASPIDAWSVQEMNTARSVSPFTLSLLTDNEKQRQENDTGDLLMDDNALATTKAGEVKEGDTTGAQDLGERGSFLESRGDCDEEKRE